MRLPQTCFVRPEKSLGRENHLQDVQSDSFTHYSNSSSPTVAPSSGTTIENTAPVTLTSVTITSTVTVVNLNGSPLPLDRPVVTYAPRGGSPITISSGSVALGSTTIAVPTQPTTLTANGTPITFDGLSTTQKIVTTMEQPAETTEPATQEGPEPTTTTGTTSTSPASPSATDKTESPFDHNWVPSPVVVKVEGTEYYPPTEHEDPIEIFLKDGSTVVLAYKTLKIGDKSINIPDKAPENPQTIDGVQFAQRSFGSSSGGEGGGAGGAAAASFDVMKGIFAGLSSSAGTLAVSMSGFGAKAVRVALNGPGGPLSGTNFGEAIELRDLTQDAVDLAEQASKLQNQLETARMSQGNQADLFRPINSQVFSAYPKARATTNLLKSAAQMLQSLPNLPADVQGVVTQKFGELFIKGVASTGFTVEAYNIYAILNNIDWDNVVAPVAGGQTPSSTTRPVAVSSTSATTAAASISGVAVTVPGDNGKGRGKGHLIPIPTGPSSLRLITCKFGAVSPKVFKQFTKWLDGNQGDISGADDIIPTEQAWPSYLTNLTVVQEEAIKSIPWVRSVTENHWCDPTENESEGVMHRRRNAGLPIVSDMAKPSAELGKRDVGVRLKSPSHLKFCRATSTRTIDMTQLWDRERQFSSSTLGTTQDTRNSPKGLEMSKRVPDDTEDYHHDGPVRRGHGSGVACAAGGRPLGVASNANLYLVKYKGAARQVSGRVSSIGATRASLKAALDHINVKILERRLQGKSVVNFSFGLDPKTAGQEGFAEYQADFDSFQKVMEMNGVVFVMAAGNSASMGSRLGDHLPQLLGTKENHLITVGGVNADGTLWFNSEPEGKSATGNDQGTNAGAVGSVTVYAQSFGVTVCNGDPGDKAGTISQDGTSFASPAVAGLVAYFLGHPHYSQYFTHNPSTSSDYRSVGIRMKNFLQVCASFQRRPSNELRSPNLAPDHPMPEHVRVAYNLINGDKHDVQCECVDPKEEDKVPAVCTVDEDCKALACNGFKKKSCATTIPMASFAIRQCKCTDPKPTTTSVAKPTTVAPKPPSTTVKAPTPTSPAPMECNLDQAVNSCAGYKNCREAERGICKEHKTDAGKHS
ncbi:tri m 2 allergen [Colletotrichum sp. SAR 10_96]|nr:tri m 2 allergen [Colletotrichum sp. SAR 10_96]